MTWVSDTNSSRNEYELEMIPIGNLNMTVLTTREDYHRATNLQWLVNTLNQAFHLTLRRTERDDVFLDTFKITGSASRLERLYAYHHFTLLIKAYLDDLRRSLKSNDQKHITSKATSSVRSSVVNLSERNPSITYEATLELLVKSFFEWNHQTDSPRYETIDPLLYHEQIRNFENELKSDQFLHHATPPFVYTINNATDSIDITVSSGIIMAIKQTDSILKTEKYIGQSFHTVYESLQTIKSKLE